MDGTIPGTDAGPSGARAPCWGNAHRDCTVQTPADANLSHQGGGLSISLSAEPVLDMNHHQATAPDSCQELGETLPSGAERVSRAGPKLGHGGEVYNSVKERMTENDSAKSIMNGERGGGKLTALETDLVEYIKGQGRKECTALDYVPAFRNLLAKIKKSTYDLSTKTDLKELLQKDGTRLRKVATDVRRERSLVSHLMGFTGLCSGRNGQIFEVADWTADDRRSEGDGRKAPNEVPHDLPHIANGQDYKGKRPPRRISGPRAKRIRAREAASASIPGQCDAAVGDDGSVHRRGPVIDVVPVRDYIKGKRPARTTASAAVGSASTITRPLEHTRATSTAVQGQRKSASRGHVANIEPAQRPVPVVLDSVQDTGLPQLDLTPESSQHAEPWPLQDLLLSIPADVQRQLVGFLEPKEFINIRCSSKDLGSAYGECYARVGAQGSIVDTEKLVGLLLEEPMDAAGVGSFLQTVKYITRLTIKDCQLGADGGDVFVKLAEVNQLNSLRICGGGLTAEGIRRLSKYLCTRPTCLQHLHLERLSWPVKRGDLEPLAEGLQEVPGLLTLAVKSCDFGENGAQGIVRGIGALGCLRRLNLAGARIGRRLMPLIQSLKDTAGDVKELDLSSNLTKDDNVDQACRFLTDSLPTMKELGTLKLSSNQLGDSVQKLQFADPQSGVDGLCVLRQLHLDRNDIDVRGAQHISTQLEFLPSLVLLDLRENCLGEDGVSAVATRWADLTGSVTIDLSGEVTMTRTRVLLISDNEAHRLAAEALKAGQPGIDVVSA